MNQKNNRNCNNRKTDSGYKAFNVSMESIKFFSNSPYRLAERHQLVIHGGASDTTDYVHPYPFPDRNCQK